MCERFWTLPIEGEFDTILLSLVAGGSIVGAAVHRKVGTLLLLPPLRYADDEFMKDIEEFEQDEDDENYWTEETLQFGKRLVGALIALADALKDEVKGTPPPGWSTRSEYRLATESILEAAILKCAADAACLLAEKERLESELVDAGGLRRLLFEQGKPLEAAVLAAMRLFGFDAKSFANGESE